MVDTDAIAHELTGAGRRRDRRKSRASSASAFVDAAGAMDRKRMRELVFADAEEKQRLEALLHPMIRAESERRIAAATGPYVVHVVPLLVESPGYRERVGRVLVVDCPEALQVGAGAAAQRPAGGGDPAHHSLADPEGKPACRGGRRDRQFGHHCRIAATGPPAARKIPRAGGSLEVNLC